MTRRRTIEDYGMRRLPASFASASVEFMSPFLGVPGKWRAYEIRGPSDIDGADTKFNHYAINIEAGGYCTFSIENQQGEEKGSKRVTQMKYRDMIIDNFAAAGGDPAEMKALGTRSILNRAVRDIIKEAFQVDNKYATEQGSVKLAASEARFNDCATFQPFDKEHDCLSDQCGQHNPFAEISTFVVFSEGLKSSTVENNIDTPAYHLVTLFETSQKDRNATAAGDIDDNAADKALVKDVVELIGAASAPLKIAKDDSAGDQGIRDAIEILGDAIHKLRSAAT